MAGHGTRSVSDTNVLRGGRSEITPAAYEPFCRAHGLDPAGMRE